MVLIFLSLHLLVGLVIRYVCNPYTHFISVTQDGDKIVISLNSCTSWSPICIDKSTILSLTVSKAVLFAIDGKFSASTKDVILIISNRTMYNHRDADDCVQVDFNCLATVDKRPTIVHVVAIVGRYD